MFEFFLHIITNIILKISFVVFYFLFILWFSKTLNYSINSPKIRNIINWLLLLSWFSLFILLGIFSNGLVLDHLNVFIKVILSILCISVLKTYYKNNKEDFKKMFP